MPGLSNCKSESNCGKAIIWIIEQTEAFDSILWGVTLQVQKALRE